MRIKICKSRGQRGLGMIEAAAVFFVLCTLTYGGYSIYDLMTRARDLEETVDQYVYSINVKPYSLQFGLDGKSTLTLNTTALATQLQSLNGQVIQELSDRKIASDSDSSVQWTISPSQYFVETAYAEVSIDPYTGRYTQANVTISPSNDWVTGSLHDDESFAESDLTLAFQNLLQIDIQNQGVNTPASIFAIPTGLYTGASSTTVPQYLNKIVVVGLRAIVDLTGTVAGEGFRSLNGNPVMSSHKAVVLRGDIDND